MTLVSAPVAAHATGWDAALTETLASAVADDDHGTVYSVHRRVMNVLVGDELIALADDLLDDAPATIRVPIRDWTGCGVPQGAAVRLAADRLELASAHGPLTIVLDAAYRWTPAPTDLSALDPVRLTAAGAVLDDLGSPVATTAFGRAAAPLLAGRIDLLRDALRHGDPTVVRAAAGGLIGLGEGLTPSGDDVLTGLAFLAAQPGMHIGSELPAIAAAVHDGHDGTGLLSIATLRHALTGRGRQRLHDLAEALAAGDTVLLRRAAEHIHEMGHTSGADTLAGIRVALDAERDART